MAIRKMSDGSKKKLSRYVEWMGIDKTVKRYINESKDGYVIHGKEFTVTFKENTDGCKSDSAR